MNLAKSGTLSENWNHGSNLTNKDFNTVAHILAGEKIVPPIQWRHD